MKCDVVKFMGRLWGDQFYSPKEKKWTKEKKEGYTRGFNMFVLDPIYRVSETVYFFEIFPTTYWTEGMAWDSIFFES